MEISSQQRDDNYQDYLRLLKDPDYTDVTFDEKSGGVSAIHRKHLFDKQVGSLGVKRGDYEREAVLVLRNHGHSIILQPEQHDEVGKKL